MAKMNRQLDAAVDAFAAQPNVTTVQVEQLRKVLEADSSLAVAMNEAAKEGRLRAFTLDSGRDDPIGRTEIASGTMRLPPEAFSASQGEGCASLNTALKLQEMSLRLGNSEYQDSAGRTVAVSQAMVDNLQHALAASPLLLEKTASAINARPHPHLKSFAILPEGQGMGAAYDGDAKTMLIPAGRLQPVSATNPHGFSLVSMVYTLAHETQHGFNYERKQAAWQQFDAEVRQIAKDKNPINDYTRPVVNIIQASRVDEAEGEIAGWNAVLSMKQKNDPSFGVAEMKKVAGSRAYLFVSANSSDREPVGRSGLTFNADGSVAPSAQNIEAMGKNYFDRSARKGQPDSAELVGLGPHKESNYPNYYGRNAIEQLITIDRKVARSVDGVEPQMHLNMASLGLEERLIERLGLQINPRSQERQPYYDSSQSPPALHHFDHTRTGPGANQHVPIDLAIPADGSMATGRGGLTPALQGHPDHGLYSQIATQVRQQDQQHGRQWDETSERMTASLLVLAKENGLSQVDHVVFSTNKERVAAGENVFVVQGRLDDPAHLRAHMKTDEAVRTPETVSFEKVEAINERMARQTAQAQALGQMPEEAPKGPGMGR